MNCREAKQQKHKQNLGRVYLQFYIESDKDPIPVCYENVNIFENEF